MKPHRQYLRYRTEEFMLEDAITITLLSVPEFREKAGLPPREEAGETLQTIARALGMSCERVRQIEAKALVKIRRAVLDKPGLLQALSAHLRSVGL